MQRKIFSSLATLESENSSENREALKLKLIVHPIHSMY